MSEMLNKKIDFATKANSLINPVDPKVGILAFGETGIEFRTANGVGFIQIPWQTIVRVRVQIMFKGRYVRGYFIDTADNNSFNFIVSRAKDTLPILQQYLGREKMVQNRNNFKDLNPLKKKKS